MKETARAHDACCPSRSPEPPPGPSRARLPALLGHCHPRQRGVPGSGPAQDLRPRAPRSEASRSPHPCSAQRKSVGSPPKTAGAGHLDPDDGREPGPQEAGARGEPLPSQDASEPGLEPDDEAHAGRPELLAVMGSGDRADGGLWRRQRAVVPRGCEPLPREPHPRPPAGAPPTWISLRVRWEVLRRPPGGLSQVPCKVCRWR